MTDNPWPERIFNLRVNVLGISHFALAKKLDLGEQSGKHTVMNWEAGRWRPNEDNQQKLEDLGA